MNRTAIAFVAAALLARDTRGQDLLHRLAGDLAFGEYGTPVSSVGDLDGDGIGDFLLTRGQPAGSTSQDAVRAISGRTGATLWSRSVSATIQPGCHGPAGDMDLDGVPDVFLTGPGTSLPEAGSLYVYSGAAGAVIHLTKGKPNDTFGAAAAAGLDLNADGYPEFLAGAPTDPTNGFQSGRVDVFSGKTAGLLGQLFGAVAGDRFGSSLAMIGSINGDAWPDLVIGAPGVDAPAVDAGQVGLWSGRDFTPLGSIPGPGVGAAFGRAACALGDIDGDGVDDFAASAPDADSGSAGAGMVFAVSGATKAVVWTRSGDGPAARLGAALGAGPDADGDGVSELAIGSPGFGGDQGQARLVSGATGAPRIRVDGGPGDRLGAGVAAGDFTGDGRAGLVASAAGHDKLQGSTTLVDAGEVRFFQGPRRPVLFERTSTQLHDRFGASIARIGDLDLDGRDEIIVGASRYDTFLNDAGQVQVLSGKSGAPLLLYYGVVAGGELGAVVGNAGDTDGDGVSDFLMTAPATTVAPVGVVQVMSGASGLERLRFGPGWNFGVVATAVGDVNGDGHADVAYGANLASTSKGVISVRSGLDGSLLFEVVGASGDGAPGSLLGAGDTNLDGFPDIAAGDVDISTSGAIQLFSGVNGSLLWQSVPTPIATKLGASLCSAGDLDQNGVPDVFTWLPNSLLGIGAVRGLSGTDGSVIAALVGFGNPADVGDGEFGRSLSRDSDLDGDGVADLLVGAAQHVADGHDNAGRAFWFSGVDLSLGGAVSGTAEDEFLGTAVAGIDDWDGDGIDDFAVSSGGDLSGIFVRPAACSSFAGLGGGCAGAGGTPPTLEGAGCAAPGAGFALTLSGAPPGAAGVLLIGVVAAQVPLAPGCSLSILPLPVLVPLGSPPSGAVALDLEIPPATPSASVFLQAAWPSAGPTSGVVLSNALRMDVR